MKEIEDLADRYGLGLEELAALLRETDEARGMVSQIELGQALEEVLKVYLYALQSAAARFIDPAERLVADRLCNLAAELLAEQLASAGSRRN